MFTLLRLIEMLLPCIPVIAMGHRTCDDLTQIVPHGAIRHVLVKPVEIAEISHALQSELRSAPSPVAS